MLAYEVYEYCNYVLAELESLNEFLEEIINFGDTYDRLKDSISTQLFSEGRLENGHKLSNNTLVTGTCIVIKKSNEELTHFQKAFKNMSSTFDFLEFFGKWNSVKNSINGMQNALGYEDSLFAEYSKSIDSILKYLQGYYQNNSQENKMILSNQILHSNRLRRYLTAHYTDLLSMLGSPILPKKREEGNIKSFSLQLLSIEISMDDFARVLLSIEKIYENIATVLQEDVLKPEIGKIESGSLLTLIFGKADIIDALVSLFNRCVELVFRKYTTEGQIARQRDFIMLTEETLKLKGKMEALGMDTTHMNEPIENAYAHIGKSLQKIIATGSPRIKINQQEYSISRELSAKYLSAHSTLMLENNPEGQTSEQVAE